ncbi:hypothetical protein BG015_004673 [Linnemannia schmuckeri]|uniref:Uncharacterized protein n=1 Tax=Linnemannia schmuckeri TaxID=64567 RepID=A0A9P5UYU3_9FUNG|nr:hypothetical protein BG015_004673 [Linnemannia schmuckeri]
MPIVTSLGTWKNIPLSGLAIYPSYALCAFLRAVVSFSSKTILARLAVSAWPNELIVRAALVGNQLYKSTLLPVGVIGSTIAPKLRPTLISFGTFAMVGFGLKMILDETRACDEKALERREDGVRGLDKDEKNDRSETIQGNGRGVGAGQAKKENEEEEPQTLYNALITTGFILGAHFVLELSENWSKVRAANSPPWFIMAVLAFNIGVNVYGLFVISMTASTFRTQLLCCAMWTTVLIDLALATRGHSRFTEDDFRTHLPAVLNSFVGLPRQPWIYPLPLIILRALPILYLLRREIKESVEGDDDTSRAANVELQKEQQQ